MVETEKQEQEPSPFCVRGFLLRTLFCFMIQSDESDHEIAKRAQKRYKALSMEHILDLISLLDYQFNYQSQMDELRQTILQDQPVMIYNFIVTSFGNGDVFFQYRLKHVVH